MPRVVAPSTGPEVAYFVGVSPPMTEITLGLQTMMGSVTGGRLLAGGAAIHGTGEPMVTSIRTNVALGGGRVGKGLLDEDAGRGRGDPLSITDIDANGVIISY